MALLKFKDYYPNHKDSVGDEGNIDFDSFSVYAEGDDKVGSVKDALVDEQSGRIRYLIVDTGFWVFGKTVLLPIGLANFNYDDKRVYVHGLTKQQVEDLPEFSDDMAIDSDYEDRVRNQYRPIASRRSETQTTDQSYTAGTGTTGMTGATAAGTAGMAGMAGTPGLGMTGTPGTTDMTGSTVDRQDTGVYADTDPAYSTTSSNVTGASDLGMGDRRSDAAMSAYDYDRDPDLYGYNQQDNQRLRLYEERLMAQKHREKVGEVAVNKRVVTETAQASVPVERERVVIERNASGQAVPASEAHDFGNSEVARMEVYEETPDIQKQAVVREEVDIRKEVDRDVVNVEDEVRREDLDINTEGNASIRRPEL